MSWRIGDTSHAPSARATPGGASVSLGRSGDTTTLEVGARVDKDGTLVVTLADGRVLRAAVSRDGDKRWLSLAGRTLAAVEERGGRGRAADHGGGLEAPMPGRVVRLAAKVGDVVTKGQTLVTLEAMKMEHALKAPRKGVVREVRCVEGELVQPGVALVVLGAEDAP